MIMEIASQYRGTLRYVRARWPIYLIGFGGGLLLAILIIIASYVQGLYSFTILSFVALIVLLYFLVASLSLAHQIYDNEIVTDALIKLGSINPEDNLTQIDLGERFQAIKLSRRLTTGRLQVLDVYNPQLAPGRALARSRKNAAESPQDPRLTFRDGSISLLPFPDGSVEVVIIVECLGRFWQHGDRLRLLSEIMRILKSDGKLLMAERIRSTNNTVALGAGGIRLPSLRYWQQILADAGFKLQSHEMVENQICCMRADKPA